MDSSKLIKRVVEICYKAKEGHIGSSLSIIDILLVLYGKIINNNHHFVLSKGHASLGLYVVLEHFGLLKEDLNKMGQYESKLGGHPSRFIEGIEASTGSLGHGLPIALGIAMGEKIQKTDKKVFVVIGDGESNEGSIWETALLASHHKLNNLYCILDYNHSNDRALLLDDLVKKFTSFGWDCLSVDGHNREDLYDSLTYESENKPVLILANTVKGKGCKIFENNPEWHHKVPSDIEYIEIINYLNENNGTI